MRDDYPNRHDQAQREELAQAQRREELAQAQREELAARRLGALLSLDRPEVVLLCRGCGHTSQELAGGRAQAESLCILCLGDEIEGEPHGTMRRIIRKIYR